MGTGYVPPRKDVADAENGLKDLSWLRTTMMKAAIEQMDGVVSWTSFPGDAGLQAEQMLLDMRDQIFGGQVTAERGYDFHPGCHQCTCWMHSRDRQPDAWNGFRVAEKSLQNLGQK